MKKIDELVGIIQGIDSDNTISGIEIEKLKTWIKHNYELKNNPICFEIFSMLEDILEDNVIDDREKERLLDFANDYMIEHDSQVERLNVLDGIIRGIACDSIINEKEIHSLQRWMKNNKNLSGEESFDQIFALLKDVLKDNIVTEEEQNKLLDILNAIIEDKRAGLKMVTTINSEQQSELTYLGKGLIDYAARINEVFANELAIYVVKGVREYKNLILNCEKLCTLNVNEVIATEELDEQQLAQDLLPKIMSKKPYVISYEEFNLLPEAITKMFETFGYVIKVINNNIFHEFYPIATGINKSVVIQKIDSDKEAKAKRVWDECYICKESLYLSYQSIEANIDGNVEQVNIFEEKEFDMNAKEADVDNAYDLARTEETYLSTLIEILEGESKDISVFEDKQGFLSYQVSLLKVLAGLGYNIALIKKSVSKIRDKNIDDYEKILKRKNDAYSFKTIDFYVEPGYTLETEEISQGEIVSALVNNAVKAYTEEDYNDVFVTAPTGAGKSILFQIPAIYLAENYELLTIIITPLIGLMNDQVNNIESMTDLAATINSEYTPEEKEQIKEDIQNGKKSILYVSPETLLSNNPITTLIGDRKIGMLVIDEAHIVTTWGKSFRPDYWYLGDYISFLRQRGGYRFPIATFSATITYGGDDDMHGDIIDSLKMKTGRYEYVAPMRRDDIQFEIANIKKENDYLKEKETTVIRSLTKVKNGKHKTIAYFPYVSQINNFRDKLSDEFGVDVNRYYGGLDKSVKNEHMQSFAGSNDGLMLATKAFGMGIDIDDIEIVYHYAPTGNLCDYVQEIGRAARDNSIMGIAKTDFYEEDFRFIKQLFGMSAINNYHIKAILSKLREIYQLKKKRNFTISPDDFAYIFSNSRDFGEAENKLKTAVLMIQKDFELNPHINFKPLIFKPRSMFTRGYFLISEKGVEKLKKSRYYRYFKLYTSGDSLSNESIETRQVWDVNEGHYRTENLAQSVRYFGDIYMVDFKRMWDECFDEYTFANFKRLFYQGGLPGLEFAENFTQKYLLTIRTGQANFAEVKDKLNVIIKEIVDVFSRPDIGTRHMTLSEIGDLLASTEHLNLSKDERMVVAENFVNTVNMYKNVSQFNNARPFAYNSQTDKYRIKSQNTLVSTIKKIGKDFGSKFSMSMKGAEKTFLIDDFANRETDGVRPINATKSSEMYIAQLLEAFKLGSYQVVSGERPEYFVRINSITQIEKILNDQGYSSKMVEMVKDRHEKSIEMMTEFFTILDSDSARWDYIERYFVGMQSIGEVDEGGDKIQQVKNAKYGKGYVLEIEGNKMKVQFENEKDPKLFPYPAAFESGALQKLN